jgi:hypothetical protein
MARKCPIPAGVSFNCRQGSIIIVAAQGWHNENWLLRGKPRWQCAGRRGPKNEVVAPVGGFEAKVLGR